MTRNVKNTTDQDIVDSANRIDDENIAEGAQRALSRFTDAELRGITSFDDAMRLATDTFGSVSEAADEIGSGFILLKDKNRLIDVPFVIMSFSLSQSDEYRDKDGNALTFASIMLVTQAGERFIITDGSTGLCAQLDEWYVRSGRMGGLFVKGGLRESTYDLPDGTGKGHTHYLNV